MSELIFDFQEFITEINAFGDLAESFLDASGPAVLRQLQEDLKSIRASRFFGTSPWQIPRAAPLRTRASHGQYEPDGNGKHTLFAEISGIWEIAPLKVSKKKREPRQFSLAGIWSTRIALVEGTPAAPNAPLAIWRMEIADAASPGCHFHAQIAGDKDWEGLFPHSLSVPRIPIFMASPLSAVEYVLGEIFQDDWLIAAERDSPGGQAWRPLQRKRLLRLLRWQHNELKASTRSPWCLLKKSKPPRELFVEDSGIAILERT